MQLKKLYCLNLSAVSKKYIKANILFKWAQMALYIAIPFIVAPSITNDHIKVWCSVASDSKVQTVFCCPFKMAFTEACVGISISSVRKTVSI
jgi:hypothetical protein